MAKLQDRDKLEATLARELAKLGATQLRADGRTDNGTRSDAGANVGRDGE